jgi:cytochrome c
MNSFEFNKMAGAVLGTALMVFGLKAIAGVIYNSPEPDKPGYKIEVAATTPSEGGGDKQPAESLGKLLASADAKRGEAVSKNCASCHDFTKDGPNKTGPNLWGIVGRDPGSHPGFTYSDAMEAMKGKPWTYDQLFAYIKDPKAVVPGNKMAFGGIKKDADRANLLAYLQTLSDKPVPFPAP